MARDEIVWRWMSRAVGRWPTGLLASVAMVAAVTGLIKVVQPLVPAAAQPPLSANLLVLYTPVVVAAAMLRGFWLAAGTALLSVAAFDFFFLAPVHTLGIDDVRARVTLVAFLATAVVVGVPAVRLRRALRELARLSDQLAGSRARIVAAGDEARQRLERNLHDGAQQRLLSLAFELRLAQDTVPSELSTVRDDLGRFVEELMEVLEELREIARGLHPAVLSEGGLNPAMRALAKRSPVPVKLHLDIQARYPPPVEVATYYVVSEALANTAKHAKASHVELIVREQEGALWLRISDNGAGGAELQRGSGLIGLRDRVEALGGSIELISPVGQGTTMHVSLPIEGTARLVDPRTPQQRSLASRIQAPD